VQYCDPAPFGLIQTNGSDALDIVAKPSQLSRSGPIPTAPGHQVALGLVALLQRPPQGLTAPPGGGWAPPGVETLLPGAVDLEPVPPVKWTRSAITTTIATMRGSRMSSNRRAEGLTLVLDGGGVAAIQSP
jgi:hypothetical protein